MLRDGKLILEGKELRELWTPRVERDWGQFGRLLPRELLGNVLLALVLNPLPNTCGIVVAADPYNADGMLYNAVTGEAWVLGTCTRPRPDANDTARCRTSGGRSRP